MHSTPMMPTVAAHGGAKELKAHDINSNKSPTPTKRYCILSILMPVLSGWHRVWEEFGTVRVGHAKQ
jgi:hypothetical protein